MASKKQVDWSKVRRENSIRALAISLANDRTDIDPSKYDFERGGFVGGGNDTCATNAHITRFEKTFPDHTSNELFAVFSRTYSKHMHSRIGAAMKEAYGEEWYDRLVLKILS